MRFASLAFTFFAAFFLLACQDEQSSGTEPDLPRQEEVRRTVPEIDVSPETGTTALPDLTGRAYRVYELFATEPTDQINETWAAAVEVYSLVIIFRVLSHDPAAEEMVMEVASAWCDREALGEGQFSPKEYKYGLDPVPIQVKLNGTSFQFTEPFELDMFTPIINQPFHIASATGHGQFSADGSELAEVWLDGFLPEADTVEVCVDITGLGVVNLHWFFNLAHICPNADLDNDLTVDSYNFKGIVRAIDESHLFSEGSHPIESMVEFCDLHDESCDD